MHALVIPATTKIFREEGFYPFVNIIPSTVLQAFFPLAFLERGKSLLYKFLKLNASSLLVLSPFAPFCANISVTSCKFNVFQLLTCSSSPLCNYEPMCWCFKCFVLKCVTSKFTKKTKQTQTKRDRSLPKFSLMLIIEISALQRKHQSAEDLVLIRGWSFGKIYWGRSIKPGNVAGMCWRWMLRVRKCKLQDFPVLFFPQHPEHCIVGWSSFLNHLLSRYMCCFHSVGSRSYYFFPAQFREG